MQPPDLQLLAAQHHLGMPLRSHRRPISLPLTLAQLAGSLLSFAVAAVVGYLLLGIRNDNPSELFLGILAAILGIILLITGFSRLKYRRFLAWECEEGFLEFDERGAVKAALRWDAIHTVWRRVKIVSSSKGGATHFHSYSVQGPGGKEVILNYPDMWQRIETEFVRLHLP